MKTKCKSCGKETEKKKAVQDTNSKDLFCSLDCFLNNNQINSDGGIK